jgi:hypothetical protein
VLIADETSVHWVVDTSFRPFEVLQSVVLSPSLELISRGAFNYCVNLQGVEFAVDAHLREMHGFMYCRRLASLAIPDSVEVIGRSTFGHCTDPLRFGLGGIRGSSS